MGVTVWTNENKRRTLGKDDTAPDVRLRKYLYDCGFEPIWMGDWYDEVATKMHYPERKGYIRIKAGLTKGAVRLSGIYTKKAYRKQGLAESVMNTVCDWLDRNGVICKGVPTAFSLPDEELCNNANYWPDETGMRDEQLAKWYETFGFVTPPTGNGYAEYIGDIMRLPVQHKKING